MFLSFRTAAVAVAHACADGFRSRAILSDPDGTDRRGLCAGRHRRHRRAPDRGAARRRARPERRGREPRRRDRRDRHAGGGSGGAGRPHAADRARPARFRSISTGSRASPTTRRRTCMPIALASVVPLALVVSGQGAVLDHGRDGQGAGRQAAAHLRLRRHRHARPFRRRVPQASHQGQPHPRAVQGRGARAERPARRPRRHVFPGLPGGDAAPQSRHHENPRGVVGDALAAAPQIPTVAEAIGDKNFDLTLWQGFFAPKATPKPIVDRLHTEISRILASPDMQIQAPRRRRRRADRCRPRSSPTSPGPRATSTFRSSRTSA